MNLPLRTLAASATWPMLPASAGKGPIAGRLIAAVTMLSSNLKNLTGGLMLIFGERPRKRLSKFIGKKTDFRKNWPPTSGLRNAKLSDSRALNSHSSWIMTKSCTFWNCRLSVRPIFWISSKLDSEKGHQTSISTVSKLSNQSGDLTFWFSCIRWTTEKWVIIPQTFESRIIQVVRQPIRGTALPFHEDT